MKMNTANSHAHYFSIALHATETHFTINMFFPKQAKQNIQTHKEKEIICKKTQLEIMKTKSRTIANI